MIINVDFVYPIGSIYLSMKSTNPSTYFGGTWVQISQGRCLVGVNQSDDDFASAGLTGGEKTHKLTVSEMPSHNHNIVVDKAGVDIKTSLFGANMVQQNSKWGDVNMVRSTGGNNAHNNLQPYLTCYIWQRTA